MLMEKGHWILQGNGNLKKFHNVTLEITGFKRSLPWRLLYQKGHYLRGCCLKIFAFDIRLKMLLLLIIL